MKVNLFCISRLNEVSVLTFAYTTVKTEKISLLMVTYFKQSNKSIQS